MDNLSLPSSRRNPLHTSTGIDGTPARVSVDSPTLSRMVLHPKTVRQNLPECQEIGSEYPVCLRRYLYTYNFHGSAGLMIHRRRDWSESPSYAVALSS